MATILSRTFPAVPRSGWGLCSSSALTQMPWCITPPVHDITRDISRGVFNPRNIIHNEAHYTTTFLSRLDVLGYLAQTIDAVIDSPLADGVARLLLCCICSMLQKHFMSWGSRVTSFAPLKTEQFVSSVEGYLPTLYGKSSRDKDDQYIYAVIIAMATIPCS